MKAAVSGAFALFSVACAAGLPGQTPGLTCKNDLGELAVSLVGAQATSWRPAALDGEEVLFMPETAKWGEEVHGGIPVCWPWFGRREGLPIHGLVRYVEWRFAGWCGDGGMELTAESTPETLDVWPHKFRLSAKIAMVASNALEIVVTETNADSTPYASAFGIHPYFSVSDALRVTIDGLPPPRPDGDTMKFPADGRAHLLEDCVRGRACSVHAPFADIWWVWNPGVECTPAAKTLAEGEWRRFYCLEPLMRRPRILAPGESRTNAVQIVCSRTMQGRGKQWRP